jgi:phosphoglycolate phosphatase-like HAD superfamily hydrolase
MLVVFDVDGTLTATGAVDTEVYAQAFVAVFGAALPTTDWAQYGSTSDRGIAEEAVRRLRLDPRRLPEFEERFVADLRRALDRRGAAPVPGAVGVLDRLATAGHAVALATGAWQESARVKLAVAGIELGDRVLVGSDFHVAREEIIREARRRSTATATDRTVYVGDGPWDLLAARALGVPFIGVDADDTGALGRAGVRHVIRDYLDFPGFLSALSAAGVP